MLPLETARLQLLDIAGVTASERIHLVHSRQRILAEQILSQIDFPPSILILDNRI